MPRYLTLRLLESFFRHRALYLLPALLVTALGVVSVRDQPNTYRSTGTFYVEGETYLSTLTDVRGGDIGYQTPAEHYGGQLYGLLQTDTFIDDVAEGAGLDPEPYGSVGELRRQVRVAVGVSSPGENLLLVYAEHTDPAAAHRLAQTLVDTFVQWQIDTDINASMAAQGFLDSLITTYELDLRAAREALDTYLRANPEVPAEETRPLSQQVVIDRLQSDATVAEQRFTNARAKQEDARLATAQTESDVRQRLQLVDEPLEPPQAESVLVKNIMVVTLFGAMGSMLTVAAVVAGAMADRSIRHPVEIKQRLGLDLLAVLPDASR